MIEYKNMLFDCDTIEEAKVIYNFKVDKDIDKKISEECKILDNITAAKKYLTGTDWYYARKIETGEEVPKDVLKKRVEAREYISSNENVK